MIVIPTSVKANTYLWQNSTWDGGLTGSDWASIALGDVDNDGDLDLAEIGCTGTSGGTCNSDLAKIYTNNGINLTENSTWGGNLTAVHYGSIAWGDIDNDGDLDLVLTGCDNGASSTSSCNSGQELSFVYVNNGTSLMANSTWKGDITNVAKASVALGDIDLDGDLDLALSGAASTGRIAKIYTNNGTEFAENTAWGESLTPVHAGSTTLVDIDNDGKLDLTLVGDSGSGYISRVYINNGTSLVRNSTWDQNLLGVELASTTWGDFDNNGRIDLTLMGHTSSDEHEIYNNTGTSLVSIQSSVPVGDLAGIFEGTQVFGDYDNDGDLDLFTSGEEKYSTLYLYNGSPFTGYNDDPETGIFNTAYGPSAAWGDLDNDNDLDLILVGFDYDNQVNLRAYVYINNITTKNTVPDPPNSSFSSSFANGKLTLSWGNGTDNETSTLGLYYNLRVGTVSGGNDTVSGVYGGGDDNGYFGNMMQRKSISLTGLSSNITYYWSVQTIDTALAKSSWSTEQNYTTPVDILNPVITINSPIDIYGTPNYTVTFNTTVSDNSNLTNVSLYGNWSNWHLNETNSSGINNTAYIFTKNLTSYGEGTYSWYIEACDSANNCAYSTNRTFIIDLTYPIINLISPSNASTWTSSSTVTFQYNVSDIAIANCSLIINNAITENDTSISINTTQTFTKSLINAVYNWSINCTDYSNYKNNSETRQLTVNYVAPSGNGGGGGGGGGAGTTTPTILKTFSLDKTSISSLITQGEITNKTITIENTGKVNLTINIEVQGIDAIISEKSFTIAPKQSKTIDIHLIAPLTKEPGIYSGKIIVKSDFTQKIIPVVLEIKEKTALFDIKITIPEKFKEIFPGDEVTAEIQVINVKEIGKVDIKIKYYITDKDNETITSASDTLAIETVTSFIRTLTIPKDTLLGDYFFNVDIIYEDIIRVSGNAPFTVIAKQPFFKQYLNWFIISTIIITILLIFFIKFKKILTEEKKIERREKKLEKEVEELKKKRISKKSK